MLNELIEIPECLKRARRALDALSQVAILKDWIWDKYVEKWFIKVSITIEVETQILPKISNWYIVVSASYPKGTIKVYPDINNSLCLTLQHQANNSEIEVNSLWRKGALCLDYNTSRLNRNSFDYEPFDMDSRLLWHVLRTIEWINSAVKDELTEKGDFFELPEFANSVSSFLIFSEDIISYIQWESIDEYYGFADLFVIKDKPNVFLIKSFNSITGHELNSIRWGKYLGEESISIQNYAAWIMLKEIPVLNIWQPPTTFKDLIDVCKNQNIDLLKTLRDIFPNFRDGKKHLLIIGFPVPQKIGNENEIIIWQALQLPKLSYGKQTINGFRANETGWWCRDRLENIKDTMDLEWIESQNWNQDQISSRGRLHKDILRGNILLLGAGCIGSAVSEILVRAGVYNMSIMDSDLYQIGNTCRHTLILNDIFKSKETALVDRLNQISPHAEINVINKKLSLNDEDKPNINLDKYNFIIDCTGSDDVLEVLNNVELKKNTILASISISLKAKHLFIALYNNIKYDFSLFYKKIEEFIFEDNSKCDINDLPRDGIGCWHPTFPARSEDIWLIAGTAVKIIESYILRRSPAEEILIYEQSYKNGEFNGYQIVKRE